jgi:hypothetical protein
MHRITCLFVLETQIEICCGASVISSHIALEAACDRFTADLRRYKGFDCMSVTVQCGAVNKMVEANPQTNLYELRQT